MPPDAANVRIHFTNVAGTGAIQLLRSLLPAIEALGRHRVSEMYLPDRGPMAQYVPLPGTHRVTYRRNLPNAVSRLLECTLLARRFAGPEPLLVLGDLPLNCTAPQTVFVQTPHVLDPRTSHAASSALRYRIARLVFRLNAPRARAFIVQTVVMRDRLIASYPEVRGRVYVLAQPAPRWLQQAGVSRAIRDIPTNGKLKLAYPAAGYPHKNHALLRAITEESEWPVEELVLTLEPQANPAPHVRWIRCAGSLSETAMVSLYREIDAVIFLSTMESYGFPLVEAMFLGLPIISADLPYARTLCGAQAIYFDPADVGSLRRALIELRRRLSTNWRPDWTSQMTDIPASWEEVAARMLAIACVPTVKQTTGD